MCCKVINYLRFFFSFTFSNVFFPPSPSLSFLPPSFPFFLFPIFLCCLFLPLSPTLFPTNCFALAPSHLAYCFAPTFTFHLAISPFVLLPHPSFYCFTLMFHVYSIAFHLLFLPFNMLLHLSSCYLALRSIISHLCFILCCFVLHFTLLHPMSPCYFTVFKVPSTIPSLMLLSYLLLCVSFLTFRTCFLMKYFKLIVPEFYHVLALGWAFNL